VKFAYDFTLPLVLGLALFGAFVVLLSPLFYWYGERKRRASIEQFGDKALVLGLRTDNPDTLRGVRAWLVFFGVFGFGLAAARPQFGAGTKVIPATNLDVVVVLDYSKSMYARDVAPSRIGRAKAEVADLIDKLPGARFGAVAYAGEPMSFPMTSDGTAIAQFFRGLDPNDMPVGGTATGRALERARELFARDPKSKDHARVIVLVTDGEDLEGDPVKVAQSCAAEGIRIDVVQVGGRAPEPIPEVDENGRVSGIRHDEDGKVLTTELSSEGEKQLAQIAESAAGTVVRAGQGETGIQVVAERLRKMMKDELSERVITLFDEFYAWPLGVAFILLLLEAMAPEVWRRKRRDLATTIGLGSGGAPTSLETRSKAAEFKQSADERRRARKRAARAAKGVTEGAK
jgi:Ca-activated chloride channel homolog